DRAHDCVVDVHLSVERAGPSGRMRILKIGHETTRPGIEGVDDHLAIDGAGDFDAAICKVARHFGDAPIMAPDTRRLRQEIGKPALIELDLPLSPVEEQRFAPLVELALKSRYELHSVGREYRGVGGRDGP